MFMSQAMDVSDDEGKRSDGSKLMKLKEELDMAESKKKELICSATSSQPSNTSAPNATVPSAGTTSSTSKIGGSLPDGSQVYLCEDVEKEHLDLCVKAEAHVTCLNEDLCQTSEPREDVVKDDAQTEPEVEGVQVDSSSPLNVHHKLKQVSYTRPCKMFYDCFEFYHLLLDGCKFVLLHVTSIEQANLGSGSEWKWRQTVDWACYLCDGRGGDRRWRHRATSVSTHSSGDAPGTTDGHLPQQPGGPAIVLHAPQPQPTQSAVTVGQ